MCNSEARAAASGQGQAAGLGRAVDHRDDHRHAPAQQVRRPLGPQGRPPGRSFGARDRRQGSKMEMEMWVPKALRCAIKCAMKRERKYALHIR